MGESRSFDVDFCFSKWTRKTLQWIILAFIVYVTLKWPFIWFFDTMLTEIGFLYVYMWALPEAAILYFVAFRLRVRWSSTFIIGLAGIIGAPIDYYFEWIVVSNLNAPIFAFMYVPLFIIRGLSADISLMMLIPKWKPLRATLVSSFIFTAIVLFTTVFADFFFYPSPGLFLSFGDFLIPYSLVTGTLGGYLGFSIARDIHVSI
ncbi:MAG: hypothetical protein ACW963_04740 [Candidatus Sifarchaeia archaeon]|jgi:hypothetical protein